jgi:hypothetical protein
MGQRGASNVRLLVVLAGAVLVIGGVVRAIASARGEADLLLPPDSAAVDELAGITARPETTDVATLSPFPVADSMFGRSGKLRFRTLTRVSAVGLPKFLDTYGESAVRTPAVHRVDANGAQTAFVFIVLRPFGEKRGDVLQGYRLGRWPSERWMVGQRYENPFGFIEVTQANAGLRLSEHFVLADFLTHDQRDVWPKFVVLQEILIDKLELVLSDLASRGVKTDHVRVLSGFRAPYYNDRIVNEGAARTSRHQYGDAADVIIDANNDGRMDDLNRDGRVDQRDTQEILRAVERVERAHPALVGGLGLYAGMGPAGPFAHVDVRGLSARWNR